MVVAVQVRYDMLLPRFRIGIRLRETEVDQLDV